MQAKTVDLTTFIYAHAPVCFFLS